MVLPHPIEEGVAGEGEEVRSLHFSCLGQEEENFSRAARNFYAEFGDGGGPPPEVLTPSPRFYDLRPASTSVEDALNLDKEVRYKLQVWSKERFLPLKIHAGVSQIGLARIAVWSFCCRFALRLSAALAF